MKNRETTEENEKIWKASLLGQAHTGRRRRALLARANGRAIGAPDLGKDLGFKKREAGLVMGPDQLGTEFSLKRVARMFSAHLSVTEAL
jgi:hypothetical protein